MTRGLGAPVAAHRSTDERMPSGGAREARGGRKLCAAGAHRGMTPPLGAANANALRSIDNGGKTRSDYTAPEG